jgi:hypothetical protein
MPKVHEIINAVQQLLHAAKPVLFEVTLFVWAAYEMGKFIFTQLGVLTAH